MYLTLILIVIFFASVAMLVREGLWSNALTLINVIFAGLLASSFWESAAAWLEGMDASFTYLVDFIAVWGVFCLAFIVFRALTDYLSKVQVRFKKPVDMAGGTFMAIWVGWVLVCFTCFTLHMAPLGRQFMDGGFYEEPGGSIFMGLNPDRKWLGLVHMTSQGSLSTAHPDKEGETNTFDPGGEFIYKYYQRRANLEQEPEFRVRPN
jgi:hypothetical protein